MNDVMPINTLAGRGHNEPPLAEVLSEELALDRERADELLAAANYARIENGADAAKIADLIVLLKEQEKSLDRDRDARKKPLLRDQRIIEAAFGAVIGPLSRARTDKIAALQSPAQSDRADLAGVFGFRGRDARRW